ncbi:hypothetical protein BJV77DRAFT_1019324 [Russula vinacea]|nr:hypothetical protein BJV77DRAFT_1019324 [Russula vinacea]
MAPAPRMPSRNVEVFDSDGAVIAGFWQYGTLQWDEFYKYLTPFVVVDWDCQPGKYILLSTIYHFTCTSSRPHRTKYPI